MSDVQLRAQRERPACAHVSSDWCLRPGIVLTNDGNAILREIDVSHPAAKVCRSQLPFPPVSARVRAAQGTHNHLGASVDSHPKTHHTERHRARTHAGRGGW